MRKQNLIYILLLCLPVLLLSQVTITNFPWTEGFEGTQFPPSGWLNRDIDGDGRSWWRETDPRVPHSGIAAAVSTSAVDDFEPLRPNNWLITPQIQIPAGTQLALTYFDGAQDEQYPNVHYGIWISTTTTAIGAFQHVFNETLFNNIWQKRTVDLSSYAGQNIFIAFRHYDCFDEWWVKIDDIRIGEIDNHDLDAVNIVGIPFGNLNAPITHTVRITSHGRDIATDYSVRLMQVATPNDITLATVQGVPLSTGGWHEFEITWTPTALGSMEVYGIIDFPADQVIANNRTSNYPVTILPAGLGITYIGNAASSLNTDSAPFKYSWWNNFSQTIYYADEINMDGMITEVRYRMMWGNPLPVTPVRMYMAHTDRLDFAPDEDGFTNTWIPYSEMTLVYYGRLHGSDEITITLDTPFFYDGERNLVLLTHRPRCPHLTMSSMRT